MNADAIALDGLLALPAASALLAWLLRGGGGSGSPVDGAGRADRGDRRAVGVGVAGSLLTLAWSVWVALRSGRTLGGADGLGTDVAWVRSLGLHWHLGVDGISVPLVLMSTLVAALTLLSLLREAPANAEGGPRDRGALAVLLLVIETGVLGCFTALDVVLFFTFFEVALIPMWFVINRWGDAHDAVARRRAATRFLVFTVTGSALMLVGLLIVGASANTFDITVIASTYRPTGATAVVASLLVGLGLAIKTPLWPLHIWLPDAHSKAPTVGSVLLAAVLLKLGTYGFVRFWMPVTDPGWPLLVPLVAALAVVGIVYAALACLAQTDLKRLIAYSSVGHMGFVLLGVATFTVGGVQAAVYASVAHGVITGLLFFLAGAIKDRYDTTDLARLNVLYARLPRLSGVFVLAAMASLGLPGLAGFWGEMLSIRSAVYAASALPRPTYVVLGVIAAFGVILTSAYFLALVRGMLQGTPAAVAPVNAGVESVELATEEVEPGALRLPDGRATEWLVWAPLVALTVVLGVAPGLLLSPVGDAARAFLGGL